MTQVVYGLTADLGDGSNMVRWFRNKSVVDMLLDDDSEYQETYYGNEGRPAETFTFPDDLDLQAVGFYFSDTYYEKELTSKA